MLHVLRHYLPLRKALLIASETVLLTIVVMIGMSAHLWVLRNEVLRQLAWIGLDAEEARWRCLFSALMVSVVAQITISFNELYDFRVSSSRFDRASRFLGSAGIAVVIAVSLLASARIWNLERILDFPGLPLSQAVVLLTTTLILGFTLLYFWRVLFHYLLRRSHFDERLLILGSGRMGKRVVDHLLERANTGFQIVGVLPNIGSQRTERRRGGRRASDRDGSELSGAE